MSELIPYALLYLFGTFISAVAQVLLKKSALKTYESTIKEYLNPLVVTGYVIFFAATFCTLFAYKVVPLSLGPVLEATSYVYVSMSQGARCSLWRSSLVASACMRLGYRIVIVFLLARCCLFFALTSWTRSGTDGAG